MKYWRDPIVWMFCIVGLFEILTPIHLYSEIGKPFAGVVFGLSLPDQHWKVQTSTPVWWSGVSNGRLSPQDLLLTINGQNYDFNSPQIFQEATKNGKSSMTLEIMRDSDGIKKQIHIEIPIEHFKLEDFLDLAAPNFINSFCYWLVALGIYFLRPQDRLNRIFAVTCCTIAATQSLTVSSVMPFYDLYSSITHFLWTIISPFTGLTIFHFSRIFPDDRATPILLLKLLYGFSGIVGMAFGLAHILFMMNGFSDVSAFLDKWCFIINMIILFSGWVALILTCLISWLMSWLHAPKGARRYHPQTIIALVAVSLCAFYVIPIVFSAFKINTGSLFADGLDRRYFLVSVPLGFALISLRYKSFRSTQPPFWLLIPLIVSVCAIFASFFSWLWWKNALQTMQRPPFGQILLACLLLSIFWNYFSSIRGYLARMLNWEAISFSLVQQFSQRLVGNTNLVSLPKNIVNVLADQLKLEQAAIWLWNDEGSQFELASSFPLTLPNLPDIIQQPQDLHLAYSQPFRLGNEQNPVSSWLKTFMDVQTWEIALPLGIDRPIGLILIGERLDEEIFDERDLNMLELIARQATLFIFSAQVTYWLDKAQEDERFRIAQDLHDTIQQSLNAVAIHLHIIQKMTDRDTDRNMERAELFALECQNDIKDAIRNLYEIRRSLDPNELAYGLIEPLRLALERAQRIRGLNTTFTASPEVDEKLSPPSRRAIYRMVKQALDNTLTHAGARNFNVQLDIQNTEMHFYIEDDGKGSTQEQRALALSTGHLGLKTMHTRVESLGGEFIYYSQLGAGTRITGWIPITNN